MAFFLPPAFPINGRGQSGGAAGKELYGDVEGGRSGGAEGHLGRCGRCAPVSGFINRSLLSLLSAGIPFQFLSHLKIQQGWKRKDKIRVLCS